MSLPFFARRAALLRGLILASLLAGCADRGAEQRAAADADLARDLALVQSAGVAQPIFRDTALTNVPAPRTDAAAPPAPVVRPAVRVTRPREVPRSRQPARPARRRETRRPSEVAEVPPRQPEAPAPQP